MRRELKAALLLAALLTNGMKAGAAEHEME
jgi:hypothetical protein